MRIIKLELLIRFMNTATTAVSNATIRTVIKQVIVVKLSEALISCIFHLKMNKCRNSLHLDIKRIYFSN